MILENIDGIRMNIWLQVDVNPSILDRVFEDLASIQLELLSYPSDTIGMLDLHPNAAQHPTSSASTPSLGPYSLDAMEHERDGVRTTTSAPLTSAHTYYNYKLGVWKQRLGCQQNSITGPEDGKRKLMNHEILKEHIEDINQSPNEEGPFYLFHPDLYPSNVILDKRTFRIIGIIDWEGACFLPLTSSCTPPKAMLLDHIGLLSPKSTQYIEFQKRAEQYIDILSKKERNVQSRLQRAGTRPAIAARMASYLANGLVFLIWAFDDVRYVDDVLWQHLAPSWYPNLKVNLDEAIARVPGETAQKRAEAIDDVFAAFAEHLILHSPLDPQQWQPWLGRKLEELDEYDRELKYCMP